MKTIKVKISIYVNKKIDEKIRAFGKEFDFNLSQTYTKGALLFIEREKARRK